MRDPEGTEKTRVKIGNKRGEGGIVVSISILIKIQVYYKDDDDAF